MRTLVCQPKGLLSVIRIYADPNALVEGQFEAWTLRSGKQIICAERRLHKVLERHHLGGSFENGALYAFEYAEMCAVLRDQFGPSDQDRYEELKRPVPTGHPTVTWWERYKLAIHVSWKIAAFTAFVLFKTLKTVVLFVIVGLVLAAIGKRR